MDLKKNRIKYPRTVLAMYLKLFCKRRNTEKNKMMEGIQSWLSLSKSEKQVLFNKYIECRINHKFQLAKYLTKVQPYLKKKVITRNLVDDTQIRREETNEESTENLLTDSEEHIPCLDSTEDVDVRNHDEIYNADTTFNSSQQIGSTNSKNKGQSIPVMAEPAPPSVRTGPELFEMLKATSPVQNNESWTTLSKLQKSRYQGAVRLLKNDYIQKYKAYLESLPSKELFNYYNNFCD